MSETDTAVKGKQDPKLPTEKVKKMIYITEPTELPGISRPSDSTKKRLE